MDIRSLHTDPGATRSDTPEEARLGGGQRAALLKALFFPSLSRRDAPHEGSLHSDALELALLRLGYDVDGMLATGPEDVSSATASLLLVEFLEPRDETELELVVNKVDQWHDSVRADGSVIHAMWPRPRIVALCSSGMQLSAQLADRIDGLIALDKSADSLRSMILLVTDGVRVCDNNFVVPRERSSVPDCPQELPKNECDSFLSLLTPRELEVARCVACGLASKEIAQTIGIAVSTVSVHIKALMKKLQLSNRTQIALWWVRNFGEPSCP